MGTTDYIWIVSSLRASSLHWSCMPLMEGALREPHLVDRWNHEVAAWHTEAALALSLAPSHWARLLWKTHDVHSLHALVETFLPHAHVMEACVVSWDLSISYHVNGRRMRCSKVSCADWLEMISLLKHLCKSVANPRIQSHHLGVQEVNIIPNGNAFKRHRVTPSSESHISPQHGAEMLQYQSLFSECWKSWTKVNGKKIQLNDWSPRYSIARLRFERLSWSKSITKPGQSNASARKSMDAK